MTIKNTKKNAHPTFNECALTGVVFDGQFTPLRLSINEGNLLLDLTDKKIDNSIFIDISKKLISSILNTQRKLPDIYQSLIPQDFYQKIIALAKEKGI